MYKPAIRAAFIIGSLYITALLFFIYSIYESGAPHYTVGKCYAHTEEVQESWQTSRIEYPLKIVEIGKSHYRIRTCQYNVCMEDTRPFRSFEVYHDAEVPCPENK